MSKQEAARELSTTADQFTERSDVTVVGVTLGTIREARAALAMHDELANALSRLAYALHGQGDKRGVLHDVPAALENADAVLAKVEAR